MTPYITVPLNPQQTHTYLVALDKAGVAYQFQAALPARDEVYPLLPPNWLRDPLISLGLWVDCACPGVNILLKADGTWTTEAPLLIDLAEDKLT